MPNVVLALYVILFVVGIPFLLWDAVFWMRIRSTDCDPNGDMKISFDEALFFLYKNLSVLTSLSLVFWLIAMLSLCYSSWDGSNIRMFDMGKDLSFVLLTIHARRVGSRKSEEWDGMQRA